MLLLSLRVALFHPQPGRILRTCSQQAFLDDWTAPHEISHLSIPFLGREHSWFAKGYAEKIERCRPSYERERDFVTVAKELKSKNRYPDMYWGGASYFMQIDKGLSEEYGRTFSGFIKEYLLCCRLKDEAFEELIASWVELLGEPIFSELLHTYQSAPASEILR